MIFNFPCLLANLAGLCSFFAMLPPCGIEMMAASFSPEDSQECQILFVHDSKYEGHGFLLESFEYMFLYRTLSRRQICAQILGSS